MVKLKLILEIDMVDMMDSPVNTAQRLRKDPFHQRKPIQFIKRWWPKNVEEGKEPDGQPQSGYGTGT